jgi:quercetin dioxygenase-like cupin family protein
MSSPKSKTFSAGKLNGIFYVFDKQGDVLDKHFHDVGFGHITCVVSGSVQINGENWSNSYYIGNVVDLPTNEFHEIIALENNTKILNINKG